MNKTKSYDNEIFIELLSNPENEGFARMAVSAFIVSLNPDLEELSDIKTAVSEAVTNSCIHAYVHNEGMINLHLAREGNKVIIDVEDLGVGISDIDKAREPLFTTREDIDRSGMGFTFMELFTDKLEVNSELGKGTRIHMEKIIGKGDI